MPFNVLVARYDYRANTEEELSIKKNDILYIENDDPNRCKLPNWWKVKLKTADPNHFHVGLVPSNYVEPLSSIGTALGLYSYEAVTEKELTFEEGDTLTLYEQDDPIWLLVGNGSQVGFVPRNYVEVSSGWKGHAREHQSEGGDQLEGPTPPTVIAYGSKDDIKVWAVKVIDKVDKKEKKKEKKGRLAVSNTSIFFGSEVDKSPVRQWLIKDAVNVRHEKSHVYLDLGGTSPSSLDFKAASKREAVAIFYKIQKSRITHHVTSPASPSFVHHPMSVPTHQAAQGPPNASAPCTCHHEPGSSVPSAPSPTLVPAPTRVLHVTRPVRVVNKPKNMRKRMTRSGKGGGRALGVS
ncbi:MAG: hypothetical protein J3Q66DRAFT_440933 [Benniella sp.]|nr:MAG: hypothetical protein J3Q66DRAFT_440933 [Benniella sp.]